jgi:hypothetical protein
MYRPLPHRDRSPLDRDKEKVVARDSLTESEKLQSQKMEAIGRLATVTHSLCRHEAERLGGFLIADYSSKASGLSQSNHY